MCGATVICYDTKYSDVSKSNRLPNFYEEEPYLEENTKLGILKQLQNKSSLLL